MREQLDDGVVAAAGRGDADALSAVWRALSPAVAAYLHSRGADDPDGLTSDVFLAVLPRIGEVTGGVSGLRTFVFSVAHARLVDDARRRARRPATVEFDPHQHDAAAPSAEREALADLDTEHVQALLARLAPDYREVLSLRVVADLGVEQAATVMGRSPGSIKQLQRRALLALRAELDGVTNPGLQTITEAP